jgi:hypothetical protein
MPQNTNLNISPYYDDFDPRKNYKKVLFKPGEPIQARELTTLQSILQDQIESFGKHFFKEGSVVIPGSLTYDNNYHAVKIESTFFGVPVELYYEQLIGKLIFGKTSGITAKVINVLSSTDDRPTTLYVKYQKSSSQDYSSSFFSDAENLIVLDDVVYGTTTISSGSDFATCIQSNATSTGSSFSISSGIFFVRGFFVEVSDETLILDEYTNTPSYRVGFYIDEEIIAAVEDDSLYDNAAGFSNYTAPGADRFQINLSLIKKNLDDFQDENFIELFRVKNGEVSKIVNKTIYSEISKELARRTYDESGDYYVKQFDIKSKESINNRYNRFGIFFPEQKTDQGNTPSNDLMEIQVGPGKAYVHGFESEIQSNQFIDLEKPRTTKKIEGSSIPFQAGNLLYVNNTYGSPGIGLGTTGFLDLRNSRLNKNLSIESGQSIGRARIYDYRIKDLPYSNASSLFEIYLFDIQTDVEIILNKALTISSPALIEGNNSGARGYIRSINGATVTLHQTAGNFIIDEQIIVNGVLDGRIITSVRQFDISDVRSIRQEVGIQTFSADIVLDIKKNFSGQSFTITPTSPAGVSTVTSNNNKWAIGINTGDIFAYNSSGISSTIYNKILTISTNNNIVTLGPTTSVIGVSHGALPAIGSSSITISGAKIVSAKLYNATNGFLYSELPNSNIASVDLTRSDIFIRKKYGGRSTSSIGELTLPSLSGTDFVYTPFENGRYIITYSNGDIESLSSDKFTITNGGKGATISGCSKVSQTDVSVITTQQKSKVTSKNKKLVRAASIIVTGSKYNHSGISTGILDGLSYTSAYGKRVQDDEISLDVPDVVNVHAIFESSTPSNPTIPSLILSSLNGPNSNVSDIFIGEIIIGKSSGACAIVIDKTGTNQIFIVNKNNFSFKENETISFQESGISANINVINLGDRNILDNFSFDTGQRLEYYDFGRLIRKQNSASPSRRIKVFYDYYTIDGSDNGELITASSYIQSNFEFNIPSFDSYRNTDVIDIRPRVSNYSGNLSPFEFLSRNFEGSGQSTPNVLVSNENIIFDYEFYLGRIDRLFLNADSSLTIKKGIPAEFPVEPESIDLSFELAKITSNPFVYNAETDVKIEFRGNKRYTMNDIGKLETRIENLEYYTTLSLLEKETKNLTIEDPTTGLNRFKSGFVVDNFSTFDVADKTYPKIKYEIKNNTMIPIIDYDTIDLEVALNRPAGLVDPTVDITYYDDLSSKNISKKQNIVTLSYSEVEHFKQPFASRVVNVNPFNVVTWQGRMNLNPSSDVWVERRFNTVDGGWGTTEVITTNTSIKNLRPQNISFDATRLKPRTKFYSFFGRNDMSDTQTYTVPKLLEITPIRGSFVIGETVIGRVNSNQNTNIVPEIRFRLCQPNHKSGPYNSPVSVYSSNPYSDTVGLSSQYSSTTTVLNIDTNSLNMKSDQRFFGYVTVGMSLIGETSGAEATVKDIRLISDDNGTLIASINIPISGPKFDNGVNTVEVSSQKTISNIPGEITSQASANFASQGTLSTQTTIIRRLPPPPPLTGGSDPLAQSFFVTEDPGVFYTSVSIFFYSRSSRIPVSLEIVTVENGYPSQNTISGSIVTLDSTQIKTSNDASIPTEFIFESPVYLSAGEYAFVLKADTDEYNVWISRVGEEDISTASLPELQKIIINKQPSLGSLFKSQNASTWVSSDLEDLKYIANKAKFTTDTGTLTLYNPSLLLYGNRNLLNNNPIEVFPKKVTIGLSSAINNSFVTVGTQILQNNTTASGVIESLRGAVGLANTGLSITNPGIGYSNGIFTNVNFTTLSGIGYSAVGIVTVSSGLIESVCVTNGGIAYSVGDTLTANLGNNTLGRDLIFTVGITTNNNAFTLTNVSGDEFNTSDEIKYVPVAGVGVGIGSTLVARVPTLVIQNTDQYDGNHFRVNHYSHGLHASNNLVTIANIQGNVAPTKISIGYSATSIENISVASTSNFNFFEGSQVSASNPGFVIIGDEIIAYTGVNGSQLTGITTRGVDGTLARTYLQNCSIQKYELAGVSLRKINKTHNLINVNPNITSKITLDSYYVKISSSNPFLSHAHGGGANVRATKNIQFEKINSYISLLNPKGSSLSSQIRTTSATSIDGSELSFQNKGWSNLSLNGITNFDSPRLIASQVNENSKISENLNKSLEVQINLNTTNENISPRIDLSECSLVTSTNRINNPILNYSLDNRVNSITNDPHEMAYVTSIIKLENPASSLKVLFSAYRSSYSDIRVLYRLFRKDNSDIDKVFELFPGYDNLDINKNIINSSLNNGKSDVQISASSADQFLDYTFTADNLPQFTAFQIKVVSNTTNQAFPVNIKDFRTIALA